jgi:hypothetical protein
MSNPWVVEPEDKKLDLEWVSSGTAHAFWVKVKKHLTVGEQRRMQKQVSFVTSPLQGKGGQAAEPEAKLEWTEYSFARCQAYIVDWSLADENDKKLPVTRQTMESLHTELFELIDNAVDDHETAMREEKKHKITKPKRKTTSQS